MSSEYWRLPCRDAFVIETTLIFRMGATVRGETLFLASAENGANYVIRFRPSVLKDNDTARALYLAQADECRRLIGTARTIMRNNFFQSLDLGGVRKWEATLKLESIADADLQTRRDLILQKRRLRIPFTRLNLKELCEASWGKDTATSGADIEIDYDNFIVWIDVNTNYPSVYLKFKEYVRSIIPANMSMYMCVQYTYIYLNRKFTYGSLVENSDLYRYSELSKYRDVEGA